MSSYQFNADNKDLWKVREWLLELQMKLAVHVEKYVDIVYIYLYINIYI